MSTTPLYRPENGFRSDTEFLEAAVLGCLMADEGRGLDRVHLADADFSLPAHQDIYRTIAAIRADDGPADNAAVYIRLKKHGWEISRALNTPPTAANLTWYARELAREIATRKETAIRQDMVRRQQAGDDFEQAFRDAQKAIRATWDRYCPRQEDDTPVQHALSSMMLSVRTGQQQPTLMLGIPYLDRLTLGLCAGENVVLGGRPGAGKTDLAMNVLLSLAKKQRRTGFLSIEMMPEQIVERFASMITLQDAVAMLRVPDKFEKWDREAFAQSHGQIQAALDWIEIHTQGISTWPEIERRARVCAANGAELIVLDHLHQIATPGRDKRVEVGNISTGWKNLLKELKIPGVMLCHLSRALESDKTRKIRPPRLSDLRESGAIEGDADYVWFVHQPEQNQPERLFLQAKGRQRPTGFANLRHSGPSHWLWEVEDR